VTDTSPTDVHLVDESGEGDETTEPENHGEGLEGLAYVGTYEEA
jgi:hypothetical protein